MSKQYKKEYINEHKQEYTKTASKSSHLSKQSPIEFSDILLKPANPFLLKLSYWQGTQSLFLYRFEQVDKPTNRNTLRIRLFISREDQSNIKTNKSNNNNNNLENKQSSTFSTSSNCSNLTSSSSPYLIVNEFLLTRIRHNRWLIECIRSQATKHKHNPLAMIAHYESDLKQWTIQGSTSQKMQAFTPGTTQDLGIFTHTMTNDCRIVWKLEKSSLSSISSSQILDISFHFNLIGLSFRLNFTQMIRKIKSNHKNKKKNKHSISKDSIDENNESSSSSSYSSCSDSSSCFSYSDSENELFQPNLSSSSSSSLPYSNYIKTKIKIKTDQKQNDNDNNQDNSIIKDETISALSEQ